MKKILILWLVVFVLSAISITYTYNFLISPIWVVNVFISYYLIHYRKIMKHWLWCFIFSFSSVFIASYLFDPVKDLETKIWLCLMGAVQVVVFNAIFYFLIQHVKKLKYHRTLVLSVPSVISAFIGGLLFMVTFKFGENYYEFLDYFLEQFSTGLSVICILYGASSWRKIAWQDYLWVALTLLLQYMISIDQIFYACFILPFLMCYLALKYALKEFSLLLGILTLICTMYVSLPLAGEYWSPADVNMLARISAYRLALGSYLIIFLMVCEIYLSNKRLYKAYAKMMFNDELTGLKNRRFVHDQVLRTGRMHDGFLLLLDIDDFKQVNDRYGHHVGDLVIQHISQILRRVMVEQSIISRWGGEEFLVIVPHGNVTTCHQMCHEILLYCREQPFR